MEAAKKSLLLGLTGNIGSGKTLAAELLARRGAALINADRVGHQILEPGGAACQSVIERFGRRFVRLDGSIDRAALGAYVFSDPEGKRLAELEALTHPAIVRVIRERIAELSAAAFPVIVIEAALFFDTPLEALADRIWVVSAPEDVLLQRVMARDNCDEQAARQRLNRQMSGEELRRRADWVLDNSGDEAHLAVQIDRAWLALGLPSPTSC